MGVVYLALQEGPAGFAKLKVVKRLRPDVAGEPAAVRMFLEEGRLSARLRHPNVVATNEVGFDGQHYFLEMEYLEGQSLEALVSRAAKRGGLALPVAVWVLAQALAGLHYAHELTDHDGTPLRVVHRDVSPHNVFVTYDGQVKVLDFGIAKAAGSQSETQTGVVKGKVTYMAPEQVARKALDRRVDVFASGIILWQILAGERLWKDLEGFEIFMKLRAEPIPAPSGVRAVDPALEGICMKALARDPPDRFATADEMQRALEGWLEAKGERVGARDVAALMAELFAEDRAMAKTAIDEAMRRPGDEGSALVPMMRRPAAIVTGTGAATSSTLGEGTRVRQVRGMRALAIASVGIALVASGAAGVATWRARQARPAEAPATITATTPGCAKNAECGAGSICRKDQGRCVKLATDRCEVLAENGDVENDRTIWLGAMFPLRGEATFGVTERNALDLARRDFVEMTHGIPSHSVDGPPRPIAVIACDDTADERATARHLAEDVGAWAVVGFKNASESIDLSTLVFIPHRTFVASENFSALVTSVPQPPEGPRLVWRIGTSSAQGAAPVARIVGDLIEPRLHRARVVSDARPMRVAFVRPRSQYALPMAEALFASLRFNGRSAQENGASYEEIVFDDPTVPGASPDYGAVVRRLVDLAPQVVVFFGQDELVEPVFAPTEAKWPSGHARPYWVSTTNLVGEALFQFLGRDTDRRRRFFGVSVPASTPTNLAFTRHYNAQYAEKVTPNDAPANSYDAFYLLAYAAYAAGAEEGGAALARALHRLVPPGPAIEVGPTHVFETIAALSRGENVDLVGAANRFDFEPRTGESPADFVVQCVGVDSRGEASDAIDSGVVFDATSGALRGDLRCP